MGKLELLMLRNRWAPKRNEPINMPSIYIINKTRGSKTPPRR